MANVTVNFKDEHISRILTALNNGAGLSIVSHVQENPFGIWEWSLNPKSSGETNMQFGQRALRELLVAYVRLIEYHTDVARYNSDISIVSPPEQTVPENIVE